MKLRYDKIYDSIKSVEELIQILNKNREIDLEIPFDSVNYTQSNLDIMQDYLSVSYISEQVAKFSEIIDYGTASRDKYFLSFIVTFKPRQIHDLAEFIYNNCKIYSETNEFDDDELLDYTERIIDYESKLDETVFFFPDLIDSYYANLVNAGYFQIASDYHDDQDAFLAQEFKKYPERKFGFWESAISLKSQSEVFVSSGSWIIPSKYCLEDILISYSGIDIGTNFEYAEKYSYKGKSFISNKYCAIWYIVQNELANARNCASIALDRFVELKSRKETRYLLSEYGDVLIVEDSFFYFIFFLNNAKLNYKELNAIREDLNPVCENISSILGLSENINLDWSGFNDEKFEQLCYDILYYHPKFDNSTIRKMGKSRSRDGGRDITIRTKKIFGKDSELFIFQCKFFRPNTSLSASNIGDAANTIMQYGAKGYGVFTTGVIDATLYDMLDGIARNFHISTRENWSVFELERHISRNKSLIERYFNNKTTQ